MGLDSWYDMSLEKKFRDAIEYIEINEFPRVTLCGMDICSLKECVDQDIMKQIVDIVDVIKDYKSYKPQKSKQVFVRSCKPVYNKHNQTTYSRNI